MPLPRLPNEIFAIEALPRLTAAGLPGIMYMRTLNPIPLLVDERKRHAAAFHDHCCARIHFQPGKCCLLSDLPRSAR